MAGGGGVSGGLRKGGGGQAPPNSWVCGPGSLPYAPPLNKKIGCLDSNGLPPLVSSHRARSVTMITQILENLPIVFDLIEDFQRSHIITTKPFSFSI